MHQGLTVQHSLNVSRNIIRQVLKILDKERVNARLKQRLKTRVYTAKGTNYLWHMDGYDKLKPFGFCIHGAIDGYSRWVLWLEEASTNNDPFDRDLLLPDLKFLKLVEQYSLTR